ncbi:MAG: hypothetical protein QF546_00275 [Alphaproteobacteria bacterium]|jgi:hypothetical protein|nr:hypothetical protein [Phycisphaerae bacterium]MDP7602247.1 hypothetical protein [Alphaproteobacteria bacterium]
MDSHDTKDTADLLGGCIGCRTAAGARAPGDKTITGWALGAASAGIFLAPVLGGLGGAVAAGHFRVGALAVLAGTLAGLTVGVALAWAIVRALTASSGKQG